MKKNEIKVGRYYARMTRRGKEPKRVVRQVINEGREFRLYSSQGEDDCLRYKVVEGIAQRKEGNTTRRSMAKWAEEDVTDEFEQKNA